MRISTYFKIIGAIELVAWFVGIFPLIFSLMPVFQTASTASLNGNASSGMIIFGYVFLIIVYVFFGPAIGLAFYQLGVLKAESDGGTYASPYRKRSYDSLASVDDAAKSKTIKIDTDKKIVKEDEQQSTLELGKAVRLKNKITTEKGITIPQGAF